MSPPINPAGPSGFTATKDAKLMAALHEQAFAAAWTQTAFADLLAKPTCHAFAALDETQWRGFILLQGPDAPHGDGPTEMEILTLAVHPAARRRGIGKALITHAAAELSAGKIMLEVASDNEAALALYAACGFRTEGRRHAYYKRPDGRRVDGLLMHAFFS